MPGTRALTAGGRGSPRPLIAAAVAVIAALLPVVSSHAAGPGFTAIAPLPVARSGPGVTTAPDGHIYTVGGFEQGWSLWEVDEYDPTSNRWTRDSQLPVSRHDLGVTTGPDGLLYAIGGEDYAFQVASEVYAYNTVTDTWTERASLPTARTGLGAATAPDGRIYAIGGSVVKGKLYGKKPPTMKASTEVDAYTPGTNTWTKVKPLPVAMSFASATTGADGRIYVFDGCTGKGCASFPGHHVKGPLSPVLLAYDVHADRWTQLATPPLARNGAAITTGADGRLYVLGAGQFVSTDNSAEVYDPTTNTWTVVPSLAVTTPGVALTTGHDGRIYVIGGSDPSCGHSVTNVQTFPS